MTVENNVPEIRFKGFSGEWQDKEIGSILAETKRPIELLDNELYQLVTVKRRNEGVVPRASLKGKDILVKNYYGIKAGDYLISKRQVVHGANGIVPESLDNAVVSNEYLVLTDSDEITSKFWTVISKRPEMHKLFFISSYGVDIEKLVFDVSDWKNRSIAIPDVAEQNAITTHFQKLDSLINQHQQKHAKLSNIKKAMLEKMFPKQGETIPEIRFKEFSGEWEEKELGELAEIVRGASPRPIEDPKWFDKRSNVGWLRIRDVTEQDGRIHVLEQRISKLGQEKTRVLFEPHLLLSIAASVGKPVINYIKTGVHDGFLIFKKPRFELEFMYQWLKSFELEWQQYGQPGSQVNLNSDIVKGQLVSIPSNEEQIAIGNYFQKLDALINQHQQQIIKLNNIKQACLSKMFV
ncbi:MULTISPECIES: restriction endonuclease subunit S [unclassified Vibrio]|uniref:restriction endonuclease subunit S n=2 Tax=unclassified Vibrio TaxID=2614977 RepID=UPI00113FD460|nr:MULTISPECIES: restriction endonuclease subunit S [unclassified Vibrio]NAX18612.1 restriction endonuclease subunit S [Vibrio sp. V22_P2S10T140]